MKKIIVILLFVIPFTSFSSNLSDLFTVDREKIQNELSELTKIESFVKANTVDFNTAYSLNPSLFNLTSGTLNTNSTGFMVYGEPPLGIPSFVWGLCCGFAGIGIVYFITEDGDETKKALYGCVTSTVIGGVLYVAGVAAALGAPVYY